MPRGKWAYMGAEAAKELRAAVSRQSANDRQCPACKRKSALRSITFGRRCAYCDHEFGTSEKYTGPGTTPRQRRAAREEDAETAI